MKVVTGGTGMEAALLRMPSSVLRSLGSADLILLYTKKHTQTHRTTRQHACTDTCDAIASLCLKMHVCVCVDCGGRTLVSSQWAEA